MADPHASRVHRGDRARPHGGAPAAALRRGARDAGDHRVPPADRTRRDRGDPRRRRGRDPQVAARARRSSRSWRGARGSGVRCSTARRRCSSSSSRCGTSRSCRAWTSSPSRCGGSRSRCEASREGRCRGMRIHRALARAGVASRRKAEELVAAGRVQVNGVVARTGQTVNPSTDDITVDGRKVSAPVAPGLDHPQQADRRPHDEEAIRAAGARCSSSCPETPGLTYVGRLDYMTEGLLLLHHGRRRRARAHAPEDRRRAHVRRDGARQRAAARWSRPRRASSSRTGS